MRCCVADRHVLDVARAEAPFPAGDDDAERPLEHLVALGLARVQVIANGEAARHELELVFEHFATGVAGGAKKDEPVAGGRVFEHVAWSRHR